MVPTKFASSSPNGLPSLPVSVTTKDGVVFDPRSEDWRTHSVQYGSDIIRFSEFDNLTEIFRLKLRLIFIHYIVSSSYSHFYNIYCRFVAFCREEISGYGEKCDQIELSHVLNYRGKQCDSTEWKLGVIRILLLDMEEFGYCVCSDEAVRFLRDIKIKGNVKGTSIRTRDPDDGAFNDSELLAIQSSLNNAYVAGQVALPTYAMTWLFLAYGARPIQIAALKEKDLIISEGAADTRFYALQVPRAKQRGRRIRDSFKLRYCSKQLGHLLQELIAYNHRFKIDSEIPDGEWPLFVSKVEGVLPGLYFHKSSRTLGAQLNYGLSRITGLKSNAKRFRITLAQRAVDDGKDKYTVADLLDHADTQNIDVYYEASPAMVERLDRHLAMELAPLAQAFAGVLVSSDAEARGEVDPMLRIYDKTLRNNVDRPLGTCGQMSFCGLNAPFACYTCRHFQPWVNAPHEEFLGALIVDRDRMVSEGYSAKIYNIKNRTILAVAEVIQLCAAALEASTGREG